MGAGMKRKIAKSLNQTRYYTGVPCVNGHTAERFTSDGRCVECDSARRRLDRKLSKRRTRMKKWRQSPEEKIKNEARAMVNKSIRDGSIKRGSCEKCGASKAHAHHDDYSVPLDIIWLCPKHHSQRHREIGIK